MLYIDTRNLYLTYTDDNDIANLYLNIRNICRYIKGNKVPIKRHKRSLFSKEKEYDYIDLNDTFDMERVSYYYRQILERFDPANINDLDTFFKRVDEFSDFAYFLQCLYSKIVLEDFVVEGLTQPKVIKYKNSEIRIETSAIEQFGKSGSVILDLLDNKNKSDKYLTFYELRLPAFNRKFVSGETDTKLTYEEKVVISDYTDNLSLYMYQSINKFLLEYIQKISNCCSNVIISEYLKDGIIIA